MFQSLIDQLSAIQNAEAAALLLVRALRVRFLACDSDPDQIKALAAAMVNSELDIAAAVVAGTDLATREAKLTAKLAAAEAETKAESDAELEAAIAEAAAATDASIEDDAVPAPKKHKK